MTIITGELILVTDRPATVTEVWIRAGEIRTHDGGLVLEDRDREPVHNGWLEINVLPGPAILTLVSHGTVRKAIPIVVPDAEATSLEDAVNAATLAQPSLKTWLEELSASILAGTKGPKGDRGPKGIQGPAPYTQGGTWWIEGVDTGIDATGPQGDPGIAPHIQGETWWVGEVDTGISARGPRGDPGDKGDPGPTGTLDLIDESVQTTIDTVAIPAIEGARDEAVATVEATVDDARIARVAQGKNLYNPARDGLDFYIHDGGQQVALAGYRTTDFIEVIPGEPYALSVARYVNFYDADQVYVAGSWQQWSPQSPQVITAPVGAAYVRMSYAVSEIHTPATVQIERGSASTAYEPYRRILDPAIEIPAVVAMDEEISSRPTVPEVEDLVKDTISVSTADMARVIQGKNLYNPQTDTLDAYLFSTGAPQALANYRLTDFIPVVEGETYAMNIVRHWAFFDAARVMIPGSWQQNTTQQATVVTAPAGAAYVRMSYAVGAWTPSMVQIEQGPVSTAYEPYRRILDPAITVTSGGGGVSASPLRVARYGDVVTVTSDLGGKPLAQEVTLAMGRNSVLNFSRVTYNNALVTTLNDDVAPIRTQQGTVGANHGLALMARWPAGSHDKTASDIGSVWTDGTSEFTIIDVDPTGKLFVGKAPAVVSGAATAPNSTPAGDLTHVSGATNTATIPRGGHAVTDQVAPWVQRKRQVVELDGVPLADGEVRGHVLTMRESYEILDYGVIHTWVRANPGQRYTTTHHKAAVGVETEWRFSPGGKTRHHTALWEISPTTLRNIGFMQAIALPGDVTRYLPGVGVVGGLNWDTGVDLSLLTSNLKVNAGDLLDGRPPTMAVDIRSDLGMAIALTPWEGASESSTHLASTPANLFDLRSTKKMYPNVIGSIPPGWGRITATGIRAYLTLTEAEAIVADADPVSAWVTLDQMSG